MTTIYRDYHKDRTGWFFGLTGTQITAIAAAGVPVWLAINADRWALLALWVPAWVVLTVLLVVPVRGQTAAGWIRILTAHGVGRVTGWSTWQSATAAGLAVDPARTDLPGVLAGIEIHDGPPLPATGTRVAVIADDARHTWAATAAITHPGIGMAEPADRDRMAAGFADLTAAIARTETVDTLAVCVRTVPDHDATRRAWTTAHVRTDAPRLAADVTTDLAAMLAPAAVRTEAYLTVGAAEETLARPARAAGGGVAGRARVLHAALGEVETGLAAAGATNLTWLDSPGLATAVRTGFEPGDAATLAAADLAHSVDPDVAAGVPLAAAGPATAATGLRAYTHGDWVSVTATILLPEAGVVLGALAPLLVPATAGERRSLTIFCNPLATRAAEKITGREEMSAITAEELRRRSGKIERARDRRAAAKVATTDEKLATGAALVRAAAAASITVPADADIADAGRRLDAAIRAAGFIGQRLDGAHDAGFAAAAIPLGVGLPRRRSRR